MRITDLIEGIRMGAKDLAQPTKKNYTIGFEYEVELNDGFPRQGGSFSGDIDYDAALDVHSELWYNGTRYDFDFKDWFKDYMRWSYTGKITQFIIDNDFEPKYGWVESADDYIKYLNLENSMKYKKNKEQLDKRINEYPAEYIKKFKEFYENEYKYNRESFYDDIDKVREYALFFQINMPKNIRLYPDEKDRRLTILDKIKSSTDDRVKFIVKNNIENDYNLFFQKLEKPYEYTKDDDEYTDFDPDDFEYMYDEYKNVVKVEDEVNDLDDLQKYFNIEESDVRDALEDEWQEAESEAQNDDFSDWLQYNADRFTSGGDGPMGYVREQLDDELGLNWSVKSDGSLSSNGVEIESEVFNDLGSGIESMRDIFELIQNDSYMYTNNSTGLHINIGTWKGDEIHSVDWLKFLIVYRAERVLEEFKRISNTYAPDKLENIIRELERNNLGPLYDNIKEINNSVIKNSPKYSSVNLSKLGTYGIIELRAPGNTGYENKGDYLDREIRKIGRALDIASDPNAYKTEYAKKLYKLLSAKTNRRLGRSENPEQNPVDDFFKQISNGIAPEYKFLGANRIISYIIENSNRFNEAAANSKYTARVHKLIIDDLKEFQRINGSDVTQTFDHYLNKYDTDGKIRNSTFMRMIYKSLNR